MTKNCCMQQLLFNENVRVDAFAPKGLRHLLVARRQTGSHERRAHLRFMTDGIRHRASAIRLSFQLRSIPHRATWSPLACAAGQLRDGAPRYGGGRAGGNSRRLSAGASTGHAGVLATFVGPGAVARTCTIWCPSVLTAGRLRIPVVGQTAIAHLPVEHLLMSCRPRILKMRVHPRRRVSPMLARPFGRISRAANGERRTANERRHGRAAAHNPVPCRGQRSALCAAR